MYNLIVLKLTILLILALAIVFAIFWPTLRRRVKRGVRVGINLYAILSLARLTHARTDQETLINLGIMLAVFGGLWLVLWGVTRWFLARKVPG